MNMIEIGRLLRANTSEFVVGCHVNQIEAPSFGALVRVPLGDNSQVYGLIYDIHIDDDGLVRQLVTADYLDENIIEDNRTNRNIPIEMSVLAVGYCQNGHTFYMLPPRPPLSLDTIVLCDENEIRQFTSAGRFGYFRHILRAKDLPVGELFAAHLNQGNIAHQQAGNQGWLDAATQELIVLLRDDYATLMEVLSAIGGL
jgi:hypothetical protein